MEFLDKVVWNTLGNSSLDSMPIGNGDIGLNVWTEQNGDVVFYLSKTDAWSENNRLLKLGKIRVSMSPNPFANATAFAQKLSLKKGMITIESGQGAKIRIWVDANNPVVMVQFDSQVPVDAKVSFEPWRTERRQITSAGEMHSAYGLGGEGSSPVWVEPDTVVEGQTDRIVWYHRNERSVWKANLELQALGEVAADGNDPLLNRTFGALIEGDGFIRESDTVLRTGQPQEKLSLSIYPLTAQSDSPEAWLEQVENNARQIGAESPEARLAAHCGWWKDFWDRSYIHVSSVDPEENETAGKVTRGYALQRWMNACGGRGNSPIKFNGSIFNVDTMEYEDDYKGFDADYRQWGGCYWWQNTRLPYWSMLAAGDHDLMGPLFKMYSDTLPIRQAATKKYYGHDGAFIPETMYFWGAYNDANYGRDRAGKPDGYTDNDYIRYHWQSGLELSLMMLDYYGHTSDEAFAREIMLPFAQEIITFYDQHWGRGADGKIRFDPAMVLEVYREAVNPLPEIVGIAKVCRELLSLPEGLVS
ncbi:MAG: DUF5703 domain-containing protein, partial [Verrucomicrobiota bacterium]